MNHIGTRIPKLTDSLVTVKDTACNIVNGIGMCFVKSRLHGKAPAIKRQIILIDFVIFVIFVILHEISEKKRKIFTGTQKTKVIFEAD